MAGPWLLHTELHVAAVYDCCERTAAKELLRRKCCEGTAANRLLRTERIRSCIWLQYTTAAKELLRRGLLRRGLLHMAPAVLLLRRNCCEGTAAKEMLRNGLLRRNCCERTAAKELLRTDCCERTAAKELLRTDCCEGDCCMRLCFTPAENGLLHTELMRSWSGAAHD